MIGGVSNNSRFSFLLFYVFLVLRLAETSSFSSSVISLNPSPSETKKRLHASVPSLITKPKDCSSSHLPLLQKKTTASTSLTNNPRLSSLSSIPLFASLSQNTPQDVSALESDNNYGRRIKQYFATCIPGLETILADELTSLGAKNVQPSGKSGVYFTSSPEEDDEEDVDLGLKVVLWVRTAHRVMELICTTDPSLADYSMYNDDGNDPNNNENDHNSEFEHYSSPSSYLHEPIQTKQDLYSFVRAAVPLKQILGDGKGNLLSLSIDKIIMNGYVPKELCHSHYTSLTVKNALVDGVRDLRPDGIRPDVDTVDADVPLVVVLKGYRNDYGDEEDGVVDVSLYRCLHAGGSLHRRGYRRRPNKDGEQKGEAIIHKAALKESLASALLYESGWDKLVHAARYDDYQPAVFVDPMTGSATLPIEAALMACDIAPGLMRIRCSSRGSTNGPNHELPPIVRWRNDDDDNNDTPLLQQWKSLLQDAAKRAKAGITWARTCNDHDPTRNNLNIFANERHYNAYGLSSSNIQMAGLESMVKLSHGDCRDWDLGGGVMDDFDDDNAHDEGSDHHYRAVLPGRTIVGTNPPWGKRLKNNNGNDENEYNSNMNDLEESWLSLKSFIQRECNGSEAWILSGNKSLTRYLRMKKSRSLVVRTAGEDLRWIQYYVFDQKKKDMSGGAEGKRGGTMEENNNFEMNRMRREEERFDYDGGGHNDDYRSMGRRRDTNRRDQQQKEQQKQRKKKRIGGTQIRKQRSNKNQQVQENGGGGPWY